MRARAEGGSEGGGGATPVVVALVCLALSCVVFLGSLIPAIQEERALAARMKEATRKEEILRNAAAEDRARIKGLSVDPQELLRAFDEAGLKPPAPEEGAEPHGREKSVRPSKATQGKGR